MATASWAVEVALLGERVIVIASAAALRLEVLMAADEAEDVVVSVGAESAADAAALGDRHAKT
jgi:hypothetical protein